MNLENIINMNVVEDERRHMEKHFRYRMPLYERWHRAKLEMAYYYHMLVNKCYEFRRKLRYAVDCVRLDYHILVYEFNHANDWKVVLKLRKVRDKVYDKFDDIKERIKKEREEYEKDKKAYLKKIFNKENLINLVVAILNLDIFNEIPFIGIPAKIAKQFAANKLEDANDEEEMDEKIRNAMYKWNYLNNPQEFLRIDMINQLRKVAVDNKYPVLDENELNEVLENKEKWENPEEKDRLIAMYAPEYINKDEMQERELLNIAHQFMNYQNNAEEDAEQENKMELVIEDYNQEEADEYFGIEEDDEMRIEADRFIRNVDFKDYDENDIVNLLEKRLALENDN